MSAVTAMPLFLAMILSVFQMENKKLSTALSSILNPHDDFTNLTVTWFRSTTEDISILEEISATFEEYRFSEVVSNRADSALSVINCSYELYRDSFSLIILHFTRHKNGYYVSTCHQ